MDVEQALALSARGMRRFVLTFDLCAEVDDAQLRAAVEENRTRFPDRCAHPEPHLHVYGRRDDAGADSRILVASIVAWPLADRRP